MSQFTFILSAMLFGKFEFSTYLSWKQIFACRRRCVGGFFFSAYDAVGRGLRLRPPLNQLNQMDETNQVVHTAFPAQLIEKLLRPSSCNAVEVISYDTNAKIPPKNLKKEKKIKSKSLGFIYIYMIFSPNYHRRVTSSLYPWNKRKCGEKKSVDRGVFPAPGKGGGEQNEKKKENEEKNGKEKKNQDGGWSLFFCSTFFPPPFMKKLQVAR